MSDSTPSAIENSPDSKKFPIAVVGCSAGGVEALGAFFAEIPGDLQVAFVVASHFPPAGKSHLVDILSREGGLPAMWADPGTCLKPGKIHVLPPGHLFGIEDRRLVEKGPLPAHGTPILIDTLLESLAAACEPESLAIILSGAGSDGTQGARVLKQAGGIVCVQEPASAAFGGMAASVLLTGTADYVLPPAQLANEVVRLVRHEISIPPVLAESIDEDQSAMRSLTSLLKRHTGFDLGAYKNETVNRRIERRMGIRHISNFEEYVALLKKDPAECENLAKDMLISVTRFFRDPEVFENLRKNVLPRLVRSAGGRSLRFWVPGCATGEEVYSIGIILEEVLRELGEINLPCRFFASDLDSRPTEIAGQGIYPESIAADIAPDLLEKYFTRHGDHYQICRTVRERIVFAKHNLLKDPPFTRIDFVSCRNVLIYLQPAAQQRVLSILHYALRPEGVLALGLSESLGELQNDFETLDAHDHLFRKKNTIPTCFVLNDQMDILYSFGTPAKYVTLAEGRISLKLTSLLPRDFAASLDAAAGKVLNEGRPFKYGPVETPQGSVNVLVESFRSPGQDRVFLLVFLEEMEKSLPLENSPFDLKESMLRIADLEEELRASKMRLKAAIEELEASNEELQTSNEELQASNEELQSANEELETVNEELQTLNNEHQTKIADITQANEDLDNFIASTDIATIFLDNGLRIRRFTPKAAAKTGILPHDIGREITALAHPLLAHAAEAARRILSGEKRVEALLPASEGEKILLRATPFLHKDGTCSGATVSLIKISSKQAGEV
ncbi:MAG: PAS domain-containing protein [Verrucomicrobia bacterium]|nr:PAS domain-containing protein [Verrucomicrobiota bacterium]